jgi:hypothetical protein
MMGFVREITDAPQRDWSRWESYFPRLKRAIIELDRGDCVQIDFDPRLKVGSRVSLLYASCMFVLNEVLLF